MTGFYFFAESPWSPYIALAIIGGALTANKIAKGLRGDGLDHIPKLEFEDGDNSTERYIRDTGTLLRQGYVKYSKQGIPFQMRNPVDPDHPQVILPPKYLNEVKNASQQHLSFPLYSEQAFLLDYSQAPKQTDIATHIVRTDLNKNLGMLIGGIQDEVNTGLTLQLPKCPDWTPCSPYMAFAYAISRAIARVLGGTALSNNEEWVQMNLQTTMVAHGAAQEIRKRYPRPVRWLARWRNAGSRTVLANRRRAAQIIEPILTKRVQAPNGIELRETDGIQWSLAASAGRVRTPLEIADDYLFAGIAAIHTSSASSLSILYHLLDYPEITREIVDEMQVVHAQCPNGWWTKEALGKLEKLDSFMAESFRFRLTGHVTMQRSTVTEYVFKDGLRLPQHTQLAVATHELNHDGDVHENPDVFDPWRSLKKRRATGDLNRYHFAYVSDQSIGFGAGTHACPGRHFASCQIKLILIHLLTRYDIKWPEGQSRPPNIEHDFSSIPDPTATVLFREKSF